MRRRTGNLVGKLKREEDIGDVHGMRTRNTHFMDTMKKNWSPSGKPAMIKNSLTEYEEG